MYAVTLPCCFAAVFLSCRLEVRKDFSQNKFVVPIGMLCPLAALFPSAGQIVFFGNFRRCLYLR